MVSNGLFLCGTRRGALDRISDGRRAGSMNTAGDGVKLTDPPPAHFSSAALSSGRRPVLLYSTERHRI